MRILKISFLFVLSIALFTSCGGKSKAKPLSEIIKTVFSAESVKHDGVVVYTKGAATNTNANYSKFKMDFTSGTTVAWTDVDGTLFAGSYTLSADAKTLTLSNLVPSPTLANGTVEFSVVSFSESPKKITLKRNNGSQKTGNTINEYTLLGQ
jgi:hypothetical protein